MRARIGRYAPPLPTVMRYILTLRGRQCFDVVRAQNFVARYQPALRQLPSSLGSTFAANYEAGARIASRFSMGARRTDRIFRRLPGRVPRLRSLLSPTTPVSTFSWTELLSARAEGRTLTTTIIAGTYLLHQLDQSLDFDPCGRRGGGGGQGLPFLVWSDTRSFPWGCGA